MIILELLFYKSDRLLFLLSALLQILLVLGVKVNRNRFTPAHLSLCFVTISSTVLRPLSRPVLHVTLFGTATAKMSTDDAVLGLCINKELF